MKAIGIDVGSLTSKAVILNDNGTLASAITPSDSKAELSAKAAMEQALNQAGLPLGSDHYIIATGVGGKSVSFARQHKAITTCLARGTHHLLPSARMAIDIGAESSTVLKISQWGRLSDWLNHDKCAAGSGIFLQQMAILMQTPLAEMSRLLFAESEVISHIHRQPPTPKEAIVAGIFSGVVSRIISLCKRLEIERDVAVTGGVALNSGLVNIIEQELGFAVLVPDSPQITAALGAAVIARGNASTEAGK
jgi:predicted CoA-substrate-specific enzyme activase